MEIFLCLNNVKYMGVSSSKPKTIRKYNDTLNNLNNTKILRKMSELLKNNKTAYDTLYKFLHDHASMSLCDITYLLRVIVPQVMTLPEDEDKYSIDNSHSIIQYKNYTKIYQNLYLHHDTILKYLNSLENIYTNKKEKEKTTTIPQSVTPQISTSNTLSQQTQIQTALPRPMPKPQSQNITYSPSMYRPKDASSRGFKNPRQNKNSYESEPWNKTAQNSQVSSKFDSDAWNTTPKNNSSSSKFNYDAWNTTPKSPSSSNYGSEPWKAYKLPETSFKTYSYDKRFKKTFNNTPFSRKYGGKKK